MPEPGNPQALNRYSYVLNNPLRYTDPTGMFSEDEIMRYLGVSTWDDVLAMFGEGGVMAGAWGFLEVLRQAELGDPISMWYDISSGISPIAPITGSFYEQDGQLMFGGQMGAGANPLFLPAVVFGQMSTNGRASAWSVNNGAMYFIFNEKHYHLRFKDSDQIDWVGVGLDAGGIVADVVSGGAGGRVVNGIQVARAARTTGDALNALSVGMSIGYLGVAIDQGKDVSARSRDLALATAGFFIPIAPDVISLTRGLMIYTP